MANNINISELRLVIERILNHIERDLGKAEVVLDEDDYWDVADEERYNFSKTPKNFEHGQLRDDWEFLLPIIKNEDRAFALMLMHVAPLLRRIGEQIRE